MNLSELKAERHEVLTAAETLIASAKSSKKDLEGASLAQYSGLSARLKVLDEQIAAASSHGAEAHRDSHIVP